MAGVGRKAKGNGIVVRGKFLGCARVACAPEKLTAPAGEQRYERQNGDG